MARRAKPKGSKSRKVPARRVAALEKQRAKIQRELAKVEAELRAASPEARKRPRTRVASTRATKRGLLRSKLPPVAVFNSATRPYLRPWDGRSRKATRWMALVDVTTFYPGGGVQANDYVVAAQMPIATPAVARRWTLGDVLDELAFLSRGDTVVNAVLGVYQWYTRDELGSRRTKRGKRG